MSRKAMGFGREVERGRGDLIYGSMTRGRGVSSWCRASQPQPQRSYCSILRFASWDLGVGQELKVGEEVRVGQELKVGEKVRVVSKKLEGIKYVLKCWISSTGFSRVKREAM